jgi:hypothetical protein
MMNREDHLAWCKKRALEYLDNGEIADAMASMGNDLMQHPELEGTAQRLMLLGVVYAMNQDSQGARRFIEGFH